MAFSHVASSAASARTGAKTVCASSKIVCSGMDRRFLPQIAQATPRRERDLADVRQFLPEYDPQQGGLATAVAPDQTHLLPRRDAERDFAEQQVRPVAFL